MALLLRFAFAFLLAFGLLAFFAPADGSIFGAFLFAASLSPILLGIAYASSEGG